MKTDTKDCHFRVIIKFNDLLRFPHHETNEEGHRFLACDTISWQQISKLIPGKDLNKLFPSLSTERIIELTRKAMKSDPAYHPPNFLNYYSVSCNDETEAKKMVEMLSKQDVIELTYIETHSACPPSVNASPNPLSVHQEYLNPAPLGIDARYAWEFCGGNGSGNIRFVDIEQGWIFNHEDLRVNQLRCTGLNHYQHEDHGTGVLGIIMMQDNTIGGIGITPKANGYVISQWRPDGAFSTADAIMAAIDHLDFGDILLLEAQTFDILCTKKIWPVEILDANFQAICLATALGIIVVEPAGNGMNAGNDLGAFTNGNAQNIFNRSSAYFKDSGAIVVAAASSKVPHTRINYSNYGSRIDCFAWGENVVTAGLFPRSSGFSTKTYSVEFCGTSSASAIIAGAAIAVQSITEAKYGFRISPMQMRNILSNEVYGTDSEKGHQVDKIGVMPDLKKIIDQALNCLPLPNKEFDNII
jgi:serine protease